MRSLVRTPDYFGMMVVPRLTICFAKSGTEWESSYAHAVRSPVLTSAVLLLGDRPARLAHPRQTVPLRRGVFPSVSSQYYCRRLAYRPGTTTCPICLPNYHGVSDTSLGAWCYGISGTNLAWDIWCYSYGMSGTNLGIWCYGSGISGTKQCVWCCDQAWGALYMLDIGRTSTAQQALRCLRVRYFSALETTDSEPAYGYGSGPEKRDIETESSVIAGLVLQPRYHPTPSLCNVRQ